MCNSPRAQSAQASSAAEPISRVMRRASSKSAEGVRGWADRNRRSKHDRSEQPACPRPVRLEEGAGGHPAPGIVRWPDHRIPTLAVISPPKQVRDAQQVQGGRQVPPVPQLVQRSPGLPDDARSPPAGSLRSRANCPSSSGYPPEPPDHPSGGPGPVLARK